MFKLRLSQKHDQNLRENSVRCFTLNPPPHQKLCINNCVANEEKEICLFKEKNPKGPYIEYRL